MKNMPKMPSWIGTVMTIGSIALAAYSKYTEIVEGKAHDAEMSDIKNRLSNLEKRA